MKKFLGFFIACTLILSLANIAMSESVTLASETKIHPVIDPAELVGLKIPAEYFTEACSGAEVISAGVEISETNPDIQYVNVFGYVYPINPSSPNIEWRVLLPLVWNGRTLQVGGGANNGAIPKLNGATTLGSIIPVDVGYVMVGDDSGHQSSNAMDASFASDEEALANYGRVHLIKAHFVMRYLTKTFYGVDSTFDFFAGGSTGGREALECATSYGSYYDGIFCAAPASNYVLIRMWGAILSQAVYGSYDAVNYPYSDGFIDEATVTSIAADAMSKYDALDGIEDGIIANMYAARAGRDEFVKEITEKYSLTEAQLKTIDVYENGFVLDYAMANGMNEYHGYAALEGGIMDLGPDPVPREPLDTKFNVHHGDRADGVFKYFIMKDPSWILIDHDYYKPDEALYNALMAASVEYDANEPEFDDFIANKGKLIFVSGWTDMSMSPWQMIQQYNGYVEKYGQDVVDTFCKFYLLPDVVHVAGCTMEYLNWLDSWCSTGEYPADTLYCNMNRTKGQMPVAAFPGWVEYVEGDPLVGTSYKVNYEIPEGFWGKYD